MIELALAERPRVLCLGAHCDDIDIGCGGTLLALRERWPEIEVRWVVFSATPEREAELRRSAAGFLGDADAARVTVHRFRDGYLPQEKGRVKDCFEAMKEEGEPPDLVFTHFGGDAHQDHRTVSELTWNTFRDHLILEYEIPKWDGDLDRPNVFVPLSAAQASRKIEILCKSYPSQRGKDWFEESLFRALMRLRAMESRSASGAAEAFHARKLNLGFQGAGS